MKLVPIYADVLLPFQIDTPSVQGSVVRLDHVIKKCFEEKNYPYSVRFLIAQALTAVVGLSGFMRFEGVLSLLLRGTGILSSLRIDVTHKKNVRFVATINESQLPKQETLPPQALFALLGKGYVTFSLDRKDGNLPYQDVIAIKGKSFADMLTHSFQKSQDKAFSMRIEAGLVQDSDAAPQWRATFLVLRSVPDIKHMEGVSTWKDLKILTEGLSVQDLLNLNVSYQDLLFQKYHRFQAQVFDPKTVEYACSCNREHFKNMLRQKTSHELMEKAESGVLEIACDFCQHLYTFRLEEFRQTKAFMKSR